MPPLTERFHLVATASWCVAMGASLVLGLPPPWWLGAFVICSGAAGLMKVATGIALRQPSAKY